MHLSTNDLKRVLDAVELLNANQHPDTLPARTFTSVKMLIATDVLSFEAFGTDRFYQGPLWFEPIENVSPSMLEAMAQHVGEHPIFDKVPLSEMRSALRVSDSLTLPEFKRTAIYSEFFRPLGTNRQLSSALHISPILSVTCSLCRIGSDFTDRDCQMLDLLTPHLVRAFQAAQFVTSLLDESDTTATEMSRANLALLVLGPNGDVQMSSPYAAPLLTKYYGPRSSPLPAELVDCVKYHLASLAADDGFLPPLSLRKAGMDGTLTIKLIIRPISKRMVVLIEEELYARPTQQLSGTELTPREREVLTWVSRGKTDPDIARILDISVRTVHKHLENIFVKLGVETRTAAASFIFDRRM